MIEKINGWFKGWFQKSVAEAPVEKPKPPTTEYSFKVPSHLIVSALEVCRMVEQENAGASSEAKHAVAFARMARMYPAEQKRDLGLAIELALRD